MVTKPPVLILAGCTSGERDVSLRSGAAIMAGLQAAGYNDVVSFDPSSSDRTLDSIVHEYDIIFSVLHGIGGEDGTMQATLDELGVTYVGSGTEASQLCFDKWQYRHMLASHNFPIANGELVDSGSFWSSTLIKYPFVLKPATGGSSIDTYICRDARTLDRQTIEDIFSRHRQMLLEALVPGIEITIGVLGKQALPVVEIIPPANGEFDYTNKYNGQTRELCPPEHVPAGLQTQAQQLAVTVHRLCGCRDYSRTDAIVTPRGDLVILETNTLPGMSDQSLFPKSAAAAGISMAELCDRLVQSALNRRTEHA